jgi:hypothetical protein
MSDLAQADVRGFHRVDEVVWELPAEARTDMGVPARVFADRELIGQIAADRSLEQLQNVATLPGIIGAALAMPDIHQGYGSRSAASRRPTRWTASCRPVGSATTSTAAFGCSRPTERARARWSHWTAGT